MGFGARLQVLPVVSHVAFQGGRGRLGAGGRRLGGCSAHSSGHPTPAVLGLRPPGGDSACAVLVEQCWAQGPGWAGAF